MGLGIPALLGGCSTRRCYDDELTARAMSDLASFTGWLDEHSAAGVIGEVGWPAVREGAWPQPVNAWLDAVTAARLPAYVWAAAPWWSAQDALAFYRASYRSRSVDTASAGAARFERALRRGLTGGVGLAAGTFGADWADGAQYSTRSPGLRDQDYTYADLATLEFLAERGIRRVRLSVTWERIQAQPGEPLRIEDADAVMATLDAAHAAGISVVLDLHNYARYAVGYDDRREVLVLGDGRLGAAELTDVWNRMLRAFGFAPALEAVAVMNEPYGMPGGARSWEEISAQVVTGIRDANTSIPVWVGGYEWSAASRFAENHPQPWLPAGLGPVSYEAHQYFDADRSGKYQADYAATNGTIAANGQDRCTER